MPCYEYSCRQCGHEFELQQRITEAPARDCPKCGADQAVRKISAPAFVLKGGGWYADGYSRPRAAAGPKSDASASASAA